MELRFSPPSEQDFQQICEYIRLFELDDRELKKEEFYAAYENQHLIAFGRLRKHKDCIELCSLGVIESYRGLGVGAALTAQLIGRVEHSIYVVCIIPDFFAPFGFIEISLLPSSIQKKLNYCTQSLPVPEAYVAMCLQRSS